ncbi:uncharacterized protein LOC143036816 [Oratosquilla oratoria]|uniref:uncharacterized protein LOC143036816 n=1 Tax=Oratosquilla oratoria TaxID=337810 RepID=UPI003F774B6E
MTGIAYHASGVKFVLLESEMACEGCVNLEDRLRMCEEEIHLLRSALCEKSESSPQPKERSTSSPSATAMSEWRSVGSSLSSPRSVSGSPAEQPLAQAIRFALLEDEVAENQEFLVVGDSMVRGYDDILQRKTKRRCKLVCQLGHGIADCTQSIREQRQMNTIMNVHTGSNDVGRVRSEELFRNYKVLLKEMKERRSRHVVCGILPRIYAGLCWNSRALGINERMSRSCMQVGYHFLDPWYIFSRRHDLYASDGIHLTRRGKDVLTNLIVGVCNELVPLWGRNPKGRGNRVYWEKQSRV